MLQVIATCRVHQKIYYKNNYDNSPNDHEKNAPKTFSN